MAVVEGGSGREVDRAFEIATQRSANLDRDPVSERFCLPVFMPASKAPGHTAHQRDASESPTGAIGVF
jgi:hypothetical protein